MIKVLDLPEDTKEKYYSTFCRWFFSAMQQKYPSLYTTILNSAELQTDISYIAKGLFILFHEQKEVVAQNFDKSNSDDYKARREAQEDIGEIDYQIHLHIYQNFKKLERSTESRRIIGNIIRTCIDILKVENEPDNAVFAVACDISPDNDIYTAADNQRYTERLRNQISEWYTPTPQDHVEIITGATRVGSLALQRTG